ncbi:MAG: hypothetical protein JJT78_17185 [Leptospira sp.]|nr:hypothetical protein [Leptospira sp.]
MENSSLLNLMAILIGIYAIFGFSDAILLHLWKFQLYKFSETRKEHLLHSIRAILFPILILGMLVFQIKGIYLFAFLGFIFTDLVFQIWDMWIERKARKIFGGLSSLEYTVHGILIFFHSAFLAVFIIYNFQMNHFSGEIESIFLLEDSWATFIGWNLLPGASMIALLHIILIHPYFTTDHEWERFFRFRMNIPGLE